MGRMEGMINCLEKTIPQIQITLLHRFYKRDKNTFLKQLNDNTPNLEAREHPWFRESNSKLLTAICSLARFCFSMLRHILRKLGLPLKDGIQQYDIIIDLNIIEPDRFPNSSILVSTLGVFFVLLNTWYSTMTGKPVIVCSATIGPYQSKIIRYLASYVLNKVNVITLREEYSQNYLQLLGVNKPHIYLSADLAFLLEASNNERVSAILENENVLITDKPLIGIAPTAMMHSFLKRRQYVQLMAELSDYLIEYLNATIIYITHTYQDKPITESIYQQLKNKYKTRIIPGLPSPEIKGLIGMCDIFICSRFHALVASTSLAIPSLGIVSYSQQKFHGVIGKMMGQKNYLINADENFNYNIFFNELKSRINDLLINRDLIAENLRKRTKMAKKQALLNGKLIEEAIRSSLSQ